MSNNQTLSNYYIAHRDELLAYVSNRLSTSAPLLQGGARGGTELAEDIVQDAFLKLLTSGKMISEVTLPALVYTITNHLIVSYFRRRTHHEQYEHIIRHSGMTDTTSTESVFSVREITERLERGLARLPENCREVYRLHIYGGMKVSEISARLGEDYKSVEHRLGAARKAIRQYLHQYA